jgi:acetyl-CoA synthetase
MISPLPGATVTKPGSATFPLPAIGAEIVNDDGTPVGVPGGGYLTLTRPWPSMLRGIWGDPDRFRDTYWSRFEGRYFAGDGAKRDADGYFWLLGRVDDVINVAGHRIGTREIEEAVQAHSGIAEVAVVGVRDDVKGQVPIAFAVARDASRVTDDAGRDALAREVQQTVDRELGAIARPARVHFVALLPKTRSGKLLRRSIQALAEARDPGDLTTIEDPAALEQIRQALAST